MARQVLTGFFVFLLGGALPAEQREPAFELYGLTGVYFHGNQSAEKWKPQFGAGLLAPLGKSWGALFDTTTSAAEMYRKPDGLPGAGPGDNFTRLRRVVLAPALVRLWRRNRFCIYAGGVGFEHERRRDRFRPITGRHAMGQPILASAFQDTRSSQTPKTLLLRAGAIVSLTGRLVLRAGVAFLPRYIDEDAAKSLELGTGFRF